MQVNRIDHMFNFRFEKSAQVIREKAKDKITALRAKIEEREVRIKRIREEYKITDAALIDVLEQAQASMLLGSPVDRSATPSCSILRPSLLAYSAVIIKGEQMSEPKTDDKSSDNKTDTVVDRYNERTASAQEDNADSRQGTGPGSSSQSGGSYSWDKK